MSDFGVLINIWIYISNQELSLPNYFFADHMFELDAPRLQLTERETGKFAYCVCKSLRRLFECLVSLFTRICICVE